jgi:hypothetical protein
MAKAKLVSQLLVETPNKVGMMAEVTSAIAGAGLNIEGICAYEMENKAEFMIITDNNQKAQEALSKEGWLVKSEEVAMVTLDNKVGAAKEIADKIKQVGIDIRYIYGTTCGIENCSSTIIVASKDNKGIIRAIS